MEENSDAHMETDVSSTTDDVPEAQVSGSQGDMEMVIVVEELKEEDDSSIDLGSKRTTPSTSTEASPKKQATSQKVIKPLIENDISKKLSYHYSESVKSKISESTAKTSPVKQQPESSVSPKKAETTISPEKSVEVVEKSPAKSIEKTHEKSPIKISQNQNVKSPFKDVKLVAKSPIKLTRVQEMPLNNDICSLQKSPTKDVSDKPNKEASLVKISNKEIKLPEQSVKIITLSENITTPTCNNQQKVSETSSSKVTNLNENSVKEIKLLENSPVIENQQPPSNNIDSIETTNKETDFMKNQSSLEEKKVQQSATKLSNNNNSVLDSNHDKTLDSDKLEETKTRVEKMDISLPPDESFTDLNNSQPSTDTETHNRTSRELKSLIKSAKESKIINECTQLKSKTRKSRSQLDTSNTSLTTIEPEKIVIRRGSDNSQISNSSEKSDKALKRSMRSQNPEFVNKCKQFLNSVTSKGLKDADENVSEDETNNSAEKLDVALKHDSAPPSPKKKKHSEPIEYKVSSRKFRSDGYCWRCHWTVEQDENDKAHPPLLCTVCPRSYHYKCLSTNERKTSSEKSWVCPDCLLVLHAEGSDTRSPAMKKTSLGTLCDLLKYALERMMDLNGVEPFMHPVDRASFPDYDKYVVHPMDLSQMKRNITDGLYGSTEAFVADVQWILHNSIIFNTLQSKLTGGARALVRSCRAEMGEIEACPECYAAAHARRTTWFTDVCTTPHLLLWAKLKGFPYWPAKCMSVNSSGLVDVRFFGAHDRAWVPAKDCFLFSEKDPNNFRSKRQDILDSMQEAEQHIRNISRKYGKFVYPPFKTQFDPSKHTEQLKMMIPSFEGEIITSLKDKPVSASPLAKVKRRSNSKGSKSSANDGDGSESEDAYTSARTDAIKVDKNGDKNSSDKTPKSDSPVASKQPGLVEETLVTRKRRRSNLEEAKVMTVIETSQPIPEKKNKVDKPEQQEASSSKDDKAHSTTKEAEPESTKKKTDAPKSKPKDEEPSSTQDEKESLRVTPIKLVALPRTNKLTPKMFTATKVPSNPSSPREEDKTPQKTKAKADKTSSEKTKEDKAKRHRSSRSNKSLNNTTTPKSAKTSEKKTENEVSAKEPKPKEKKKETDEANKSTADSSKSDTPKPVKDRLNFDDDITLAVIARERRRSNANLPTISSVCSLSTIAQASLTTSTATTSVAQTELTVQASSNSSIFTPTSVETVRNMKDAVTKLQKLRDNTEPVVGRVGVRAFARMTSVERSADNVQVEIKAEPVDVEEDEVRLSEKMDLMAACKLQPVNQAQSLRDVRISRVVSGPAAKKAEARPRAKKTFPQPRPSEGRSELNGKNSMVYIPIQPPVTQPPVRAVRPAAPAVRPAAPAVRPAAPAAPAIRLNAPASTGNNTVNTIITPLKPSTSHSSPVVSVPTVGQVSVPTVGQIPTTVHTVPLMTSVNGQWMFSLQPIMSVGGVDNSNASPMVNGTAPPSMVPLSSTTSNVVAQPNRTANDNSIEMPRLQARPLEAAGAVPAPPAAGPLSTKIHQNAQKLTEFFRALIEDTIEKSEEPAAAATTLRLQMEQARWRHSQEVDELKHNHELTLAEMRLSFEKDKLRLVAEARRTAQVELDAAVKLAKSKQWCANCSQEAQLYCCWNTAYCDYPCQRSHWPHHFPHCAQRPKDGNGDETSTPESRLQTQPDVMPALQKSSATPAPTLTVGGKLARVFSPQDGAQPKASIIVSMVEDNSGNQTMKCVGTYKPGAAHAQLQPLVLNKQVITEEAAKKVVTSGGYLIVGAGNNASVITPAQARRPNTIQYFS